MKYINIVIMLLLLVSTLSAEAVEKKDKANKRAAMMLQKLKQDHAAEIATLQSKIDAEKTAINEKVLSVEIRSNQKVKGYQRTVRDLQLEKEQLLTKQEALIKNVESLELALKEEKELLSQARTDMKVNEDQRKNLVSKLAQSHKSLTTCQENNLKLSSIGMELVHLYESPSLYEKAMRSEPFFQLKRVELENILQSHDDNIRDMTLEKKAQQVVSE